jgi:hypothetical protein
MTTAAIDKMITAATTRGTQLRPSFSEGGTNSGAVSTSRILHYLAQKSFNMFFGFQKEARLFLTCEPLAKLPGNRHYGFRCPFGAMACSEGVATFHTTYPPPVFLA